MDEADMRFQVTKNKLDNSYQRMLNYMNIGLASIVTIIIGMIIYFLQYDNKKAVAIFLFFGVVSGLAVIKYFEDRLNQITEDISKLGKLPDAKSAGRI